MSKTSLSLQEINKIQNLRKTGHTLSEIKNITKRSNGTISKYIKNVSILLKYQEIWKVKRGGSKVRSEREWKEAKEKASQIIKNISFKERMLILSCLYWGEGNKTELNLINSDPVMIKVVLFCLKDLGVKNNELKISLRLFEDIDRDKAIVFWSRALSVQPHLIQNINIIKGKKVGRLQYGMCRLRVKKGGRYFKLIISMINFIKSNI
ncbi:hypothetical protein COU49_00245 [Candidatus Nomurabacteria bacterium CG10_big_fil_rev_8_21_14_0_10_35_16]|uniref:Transposase IS30-like HTH domain-containing protein n=1 Tax=Candidatus Nomurabacteria bacterium CG10_big_fil_rev_8_21_14_0_10_35_16 TaxID=1974731 RepID=A0A2H0TC30_9BACT|nr:MAG: hypothetical protein COU49_00245 [Candidatus Nomurabacteria bacterium CG10_big_fil_rev_8_21_14_0_10_35_16]